MSGFGSAAQGQGGGLFSNIAGPANNNPTPPGQQPNVFGSGGLFGNLGTNTASGSGVASGGNLFGGGNAKSTPPTGGLFGNTSTTASAPSTGIFGNQNATGSVSPANPLFGGGSSATTNTFLGSSSSNANPTPASNPLFSGGSSNPAPSAGLFGSSTFSLPKSTDTNTSNTSKPSGSSFFNAPSSTTNTVSGSTSTTGPSLFSLPQKPAENASATLPGTTPTISGTGGGLFGGGLFGKTSAPVSGVSSTPSFPLGGGKDAPAAAPASASATTPTAPAGGLFGNLTVKPAEKKDGPAPAFSLFGAAKADEKKDSPVSAVSTTVKVSDSDKPGNSATTPTSGTIAVAPPSMLRGKTLEEIINRWSSELETHVREFSRFAGEVAVWDRALIENANNLAALHSHVLAAERHQVEIDHSLLHIEQQQNDLASTLDTYEKASQEILGGQGGSLRTLDTGPADTERDKNYMLATDLQTQLDDLSGSLSQMIESVNALSLPSQANGGETGDDAMTQIAQILSSHLESLQWIDSAAREVEGKVTDVEKRVRESGHNLSGNGGSRSRGFGLDR